jgi:mannose-6-phosphate isomerase
VAAVEEVSAREALSSWFLEHACALWWERGADREHGGFHERLHLDGEPTGEPRRARLHPRQMYAFRIARELGWSGPAEQAVEHALRFFLDRYRREDHFFRSLVAADGAALVDSAVLYDQAVALLGLACAHDVLGREDLRDTARDLRDRLERHFAHAVEGFEEAVPRKLPLLSNSHMHLLEACLAWMECDPQPRWRELAASLVKLALTRFIADEGGVLREYFDGDWQPLPGLQGRMLEPGHHFEWAWLLLRWSAVARDQSAMLAGLRLFELGERGVDRERQAVVDVLLDDMSVHDARARLWPQTERIKAACLAARTTRHARYAKSVAEASATLLRYLDTPLRGLWRDKLKADNTFIEEPAPASSFYHLAGAVRELMQTGAGDLQSK